MKIITLDEANADLEGVLNNVVDDLDITIITQQNTQAVVIMPLSTYDGLIETLYLLHSANNALSLEKSIQKFKVAR